jgi:hypothetical protein
MTIFDERKGVRYLAFLFVRHLFKVNVSLVQDMHPRVAIVRLSELFDEVV